MTKSSPERVLALGALCTSMGLAIASTAPIARGGASVQQIVGGVVVVIGWVVLAWGIHRFGRSSEG